MEFPSAPPVRSETATPPCDVGADHSSEAVEQRDLGFLDVHELARSLPQMEGVECAAPPSACDDDDCCPICLQPLGVLAHGLQADVARLQCGHAYCLSCVLRWVSHKGDNATCALCKTRIGTLLYCARDISGNRLDCVVEQPIVLLQRARWLGAGEYGGEDGPCDDSPEEEDYTFADEEEELLVRDARVRRALLANRRFGSGGILRQGRMYARVVPPRGAACPSTSGGGSSSSAASCMPSQQQPTKKSVQKEKREAKAAAAAQKEAAKRERLRERVLQKPASGMAQASAPESAPEPLVDAAALS